MKMLCIRGHQRPAFHNGLRSGQVYDVVMEGCPGCGKKYAQASGSTFHKRMFLNCMRCRKGRTLFKMVPWSPDRFVPFDPDKLGVTVKEVKALYKPGVKPGVTKPVKEKA